MTKLVRNVITGASIIGTLALGANAEEKKTPAPELWFDGVTVGASGWHQTKPNQPQNDHFYTEPLQVTTGVTVKGIAPRTNLNLNATGALFNTDMVQVPGVDQNLGGYINVGLGGTYTTNSGNRVSVSVSKLTTIAQPEWAGAHGPDRWIGKASFSFGGRKISTPAQEK